MRHKKSPTYRSSERGSSFVLADVHDNEYDPHHHHHRRLENYALADGFAFRQRPRPHADWVSPKKHSLIKVLVRRRKGCREGSARIHIPATPSKHRESYSRLRPFFALFQALAYTLAIYIYTYTYRKLIFTYIYIYIYTLIYTYIY